jgi:hypothetical protein
MPIDPATGMPAIDPNTDMPIDPYAAALPVNPATGMPWNSAPYPDGVLPLPPQQQGLPVPPYQPGIVAVPGSYVLVDAEGYALDDWYYTGVDAGWDVNVLTQMRRSAEPEELWQMLQQFPVQIVSPALPDPWQYEAPIVDSSDEWFKEDDRPFDDSLSMMGEISTALRTFDWKGLHITFDGNVVRGEYSIHTKNGPFLVNFTLTLGPLAAALEQFLAQNFHTQQPANSSMGFLPLLIMAPMISGLISQLTGAAGMTPKKEMAAQLITSAATGDKNALAMVSEIKKRATAGDSQAKEAHAVLSSTVQAKLSAGDDPSYSSAFSW